MDSRTVVDGLLAGLGAKIGAPGLALAANGTCGFDFKAGLSVVIELPEQADLLHIYSPIMTIPAEGQAELFRKLLRLNLFCYETNGATFAISEPHNLVILDYSHPLEGLDQIQFETILENFLATLDRLQAELLADTGGRDGDPEALDVPPDAGPFLQP